MAESPKPETPKFSAILSDPDYLKLDPEGQYKVRAWYFGEYVAPDPDFMGLSPVDQARVKDHFLGQPPRTEGVIWEAVKQGISEFARQVWPEGPGPIEALTGAPDVGGVNLDIPIKALGIPARLVSGAVKGGGALVAQGLEAVGAKAPLERVVGPIPTTPTETPLSQAAEFGTDIALGMYWSRTAKAVQATAQAAKAPVGAALSAPARPRYRYGTEGLRELEEVAPITAELPSQTGGLAREIVEQATKITGVPSPHLTPLTFAERMGVLKTKYRVPRLMDWPVTEVARAHPSAMKVVDGVSEAADRMHVIGNYLVQQVNTAYRGLSTASMRRVGKALDGGDTSMLTDVEMVSHNKIRELLNEVADWVGLDKNRRITEYFPHLFEQVSIDIKGRLITGDAFIPVHVVNTIPRNVLPFFLRARTSAHPATDLGVEPLLAYMRGAARRIAVSGGYDPVLEKTIPGLLPKIKGEIGKIPPELSQYFADYVNDWIGVAQNYKFERIQRSVMQLIETHNGDVGAVQKALASRPWYQQWADKLDTESLIRMTKAYQFMRTLGGNILSAGLNISQVGFTFARVSTGSFLQAVKDLRDPVLNDLARKHNVGGTLTKQEVELINSIPLERVLEKGVSILGAAFRGSETLVRRQAFFAGLRDAGKMGLTGDEAVAYAKFKVVRPTQFSYGKEAMPETFRKPGWGQALTQYKLFPINYALEMKNLVLDDAKAGRYLFPQFTKFVLFNLGLFGSGAVTMGLDKKVFEKLFDDPDVGKAIRTGLFPALGIFLGNQIGMGVLPVEDFRSMMFFLPGPAASMVMGAASAFTGKELNLTNLTNIGKDLTLDQRVSRFVKLVPGGITLERLRQGLLEAEMEGEIRIPMIIKQALLMAPLTQTNPKVADPEQAPLGVIPVPDKWRPHVQTLKTFIGVQGVERHEIREKYEKDVEQIEAERRLTRVAHQLLVVGTPDALDRMNALIAEYETAYGVPYTGLGSRQAIRSAIEGATTTREQRMQKHAPKRLQPFLQRD